MSVLADSQFNPDAYRMWRQAEMPGAGCCAEWHGLALREFDVLKRLERVMQERNGALPYRQLQNAIDRAGMRMYDLIAAGTVSPELREEVIDALPEAGAAVQYAWHADGRTR